MGKTATELTNEIIALKREISESKSDIETKKELVKKLERERAYALGIKIGEVWTFTFLEYKGGYDAKGIVLDLEDNSVYLACDFVRGPTIIERDFGSLGERLIVNNDDERRDWEYVYKVARSMYVNRIYERLYATVNSGQPLSDEQRGKIIKYLERKGLIREISNEAIVVKHSIPRRELLGTEMIKD